MIKKDLVKHIATQAGCTLEEAEKLLVIFLEGIEKSLREDAELKIINFGSFQVKERAAHQGKNPKTGEVIDVPASKYINFRASKQLKERVTSPKKATTKKATVIKRKKK